MHYLTILKIQVLWVVFGAIIIAAAFLHASTKAHVDTHGIAVYPRAMAAVISDQDTQKLIQSLNINQPIPADRLTTLGWKPSIESLSGLELRLQGDGRVRLTGLSYTQLQSIGVQLPVFVIQ